MNKRSQYVLPLITAAAALAAIFLALTLSHYRIVSSSPAVVVLDNFRSDTGATDDRGLPLFEKDLTKQHRYLGYASYARLIPGEYNAAFAFTGPDTETVRCSFDIVSVKGKRTEALIPGITVNGRSIKKFSFSLDSRREVEPRVKLLGGSERISLASVTIKRIRAFFPAGGIALESLYLMPVFSLALLAFLYAFFNDPKWKFVLSLFLAYTGLFLIIKFAWMSEDALITLRHVDNLLAGYGPVFNPGERVEGYTHTSWFWLVSLLRFAGVPAKGAMVIPGIVFSALSLYLLFFVLWRDRQYGFPLGFSGAVLIGMSAFRDFGTSALETGLSYLLLMLYSLFISNGKWKTSPAPFGMMAVLMTLTRPDFGIFLIFGLLLYFVHYLLKQVPLKHIMLYLSPPVLILGAYEIFRMGYYGSIFPNPFYAKSGSASHYSQGLIYLGDLLKGSGFGLIIILALIMLTTGRSKAAGELKNRSLILAAGILYAFFIIRGGGDFMHGRFLLPAVILIAVSSSGAFDRIFDRSRLTRISAVMLTIALLLISISIIPVQKRGGNVYSKGISDERFTFYGNTVFPVSRMMNDDHIFMWKTIGNNYRYLAEKTRKKIRIAYHTVGFIGYHAGPAVNVVDRLGLTDPVTARLPIQKRGRPGHEKSAPFGYLIYRELTFGETPFKLWNDLANTRFGILWDISRSTLNRYSFFIGSEFKSRLDSGITGYLNSLPIELTPEHADFLFFLKKFWYPHSSPADRILFDSKYNDEFVHAHSDAFLWIKNNLEQVRQWDSVTRGRLTGKKFIDNIQFALLSIFRKGEKI